MLKVCLTKNYMGFHIEGTYDDLYFLYDAIDHFLGYEECDNLYEESMRLHILGFLSELRNTYLGKRDVITKLNNLTDELKKDKKIKKSIKEDVYYGFDYVVPELLQDILIFRHFIRKNEEELEEFDIYYSYANTFYSLVIESLKEILTKVQLKNCKHLLAESFMPTNKYTSQWFTKVAIDYINYAKTRKKKEFMNILDLICNWHDYKEYVNTQKEVEEKAKLNKCSFMNVELDEYPKDIKW